jgi:hypothetical protein
MNYWRLRIKTAKNCEYNVYYKNPLTISNIAKEAVKDGDLISTHFNNIKNIDKISKEEYHIYMWD